MKAILLAITLLFSSLLFSFELPHNSGPVVDQAGIFSARERLALSRALMQLKQNDGPEIQILLINSLEGESIENYSISVMDSWKIGDKKKDNGILFLVALKDRKMRIEVGDGLEGELTDLKASQIISEVRGFFKKKRYRDGVLLGTSLISQTIGAQLTDAPPVRRSRRKSGGSSIMTILFFIIFFAFSSGRGGRGGRGGGLLNALLIGSMLSGGGRSYGGGDSFGGSFGGGGSFSGGGASGGW